MTFWESVGRKVMEPPWMRTSTTSDDAEKESADVKKDPPSPEEDSCQGIPSAPNCQPLKGMNGAVHQAPPTPAKTEGYPERPQIRMALATTPDSRVEA
ncbi:hypothetical protein NDU88_004401 [Pleurodeles waltl]|uniref:Uncharacterized protein n=1 Tax=Pleurodeles waltl TaxID=8319 RepID=A0AAV7PHC6_PLEWA|nr:hypothetical protein NDU88_004401 [Pleurodeles waltl]